MSGRDQKNLKHDRESVLMPPVALIILTVLTIILLIVGVYVYRFVNKAFTEYELELFNVMSTRCAMTGAEQLYLESAGAADKGTSLDLADVIGNIGGIRYDPDYVEWNHSLSTFDYTDLMFRVIVLRGDGSGLVISTDDGSMAEFDSAFRISELARNALHSNMPKSWSDTEFPPLKVQLHSTKGTPDLMSWQIAVWPAGSTIIYGESMILSDTTGAGIGMIAGMDETDLSERCSQNSLKGVVIVAGTVWLIILGLSLAVHHSLSLLRSMQGYMKGMRLGQNILFDELKKMFTPDRTKQADEMTELSESFKFMAGNLIDYRETVEELKARYGPFVPDALLALLGKDDIRQIAPGDSADIAGDLIRVTFVNKRESETAETVYEDTVNGASESVSGYDESASAFRQRNRLYAAVCEIVLGRGGHIISFSTDGLIALFPQFDKNDAAIAEEEIRAVRTRDSGVRRIRTQTEHGTFRLRVVGFDGCMAIQTDRIDS